MRTTKSPNRRLKGFTLVEIIGVVALIAILAAILAPRITNVVGRGKVSGTSQAIASLKTATMDYLGAHSSFPLRAGTAATDKGEAEGRFDADLVANGFTEKLFACPIGSQVFDGSELTQRTHVRSLRAKKDKTVDKPTATDGGDCFDLDRDRETADFTTAQTIVSVFIPRVALADAIALNKLIDNDVNKNNKADTVGRCIYSAADDRNEVTVYVYVAHY